MRCPYISCSKVLYEKKTFKIGAGFKYVHVHLHDFKTITFDSVSIGLLIRFYPMEVIKALVSIRNCHSLQNTEEFLVSSEKGLGVTLRLILIWYIVTHMHHCQIPT